MRQGCVCGFRCCRVMTSHCSLPTARAAAAAATQQLRSSLSRGMCTLRSVHGSTCCSSSRKVFLWPAQLIHNSSSSSSRRYSSCCAWASSHTGRAAKMLQQQQQQTVLFTAGSYSSLPACVSRQAMRFSSSKGSDGSSSSSGSGSSSSGSNDNSSSSSSSSSRVPGRPPSGSQISSSSNPYIQHCVKLRSNARYRQQQQRLLVAGSTLLTELADASPGGLQAVTLFLKPRAAVPPGVSTDCVITVSDAVMRKLTGLMEAAGVTVAAELSTPAFVDLTTQLEQQQQGQQQRQLGQGQQGAGQQQQQQQQGQGQQRQGPQLQQQGQQQQLQLRRLLVLEAVQDPGNLGTLLRCAAAFGWDAVWLLPGCCDPFNDKALRASRGASFKVPLAAGSLQQLLQVVDSRGMLLLAAEPNPEGEEAGVLAPGVSAAGAAAAAAHGGGSSSGSSETANVTGSSDGSGGSNAGSSGSSSGSIGSSSSSGSSNSSSSSSRGSASGNVSHSNNQPVALVLGSEGSGLSREVLAVARPLAIPMVGDMESLNVGVAGSILMFCLSDGFGKLTARLQALQL